MNKAPTLNGPDPEQYVPAIRNEGGVEQVWDPVRRKHVRFTPEEWVRQVWLLYLLKEQQFPRGWIAVEQDITVNRLTKRCDIIVYEPGGIPGILVECKAPGVKIAQKAFDQAARYNMTLQVPYFILTNGAQTYCCTIDAAQQQYRFLDRLPDKKALLAAFQSGEDTK